MPVSATWEGTGRAGMAGPHALSLSEKSSVLYYVIVRFALFISRLGQLLSFSQRAAKPEPFLGEEEET